jgi:hypothetical protein
MQLGHCLLTAIEFLTPHHYVYLSIYLPVCLAINLSIYDSTALLLDLGCIFSVP